MLLTALAISLGVNILLFIPAYIIKTDKLTDFTYGISFILVVGYLYLNSPLNITHMILSAMISLWAIRLITYLAIRIHKMKKDKRFNEMRNNFFKWGSFWVLQGVSTWVILLPTILFFQADTISLTSISFLGIGVWLTGLVIETISDLQKYKFINNPQNKGQWIDTGLWKYSRHPNYFGEITNWLGIFIFTIPALSGINLLIGAISPLHIAFLLIFISGIPLLEKGADKRWGDNPKYQEYKEKTSILIPLPKG